MILTIQKILFILLFSFFFWAGTAQGVDDNEFEKKYQDLLNFIEMTQDSVEKFVYLVKNSDDYSEIQNAKINYLQFKSLTFDEFLLQNEIVSDPIIDSNDSRRNLEKGVGLIIQSRIATGMQYLKAYIRTADPQSDSVDYAKIYVAEGYRKIKEYQKGMDVIYGLLNHGNLSLENKAFAYNRLAALYAGCGKWLVETKYDSVVAYSNLCIDISEKNGFTFHMATAQNELAFYYIQRKEFDKAFYYGNQALKNFLEIDETLHAANVEYNLAVAHSRLGNYSKAISILMNAVDMTDVNESRSLFIKIYLLLSSNYALQEDYHKAFEYLSIGRKMQVSLHSLRTRAQIYDMAAKYESEEKEKENNKLRMENEIEELNLKNKNRAINFLIIGILMISIAFLIIIIQFYQKKKAYNILVKRNLEIVNAENEYGLLLGDVESVAIKSEQRANNESSKLIETLETYMKNEKPYLYSDISLDEISQSLNTNRTYISRLINEHHNKNFNDFINEYRLKTARHLLADKSKDHITIEGIGQMSGFNSRSTFFTCFKKYTGISPSYFRQSIKK